MGIQGDSPIPETTISESESLSSNNATMINADKGNSSDDFSPSSKSPCPSQKSASGENADEFAPNPKMKRKHGKAKVRFKKYVSYN